MVISEPFYNIASVIKKQGMGTEEKIKDVRDEIVEWLTNNERSLRWLSLKIEVNYNTMYSIFTQRIIALSDENLKRINSELKTKFKK